MGAGESAFWAAKLRLGIRATVTADRIDGRPVVSCDGHRLAYRFHPGIGGYFRSVVPCAVCGKETVSRTHQIYGRPDLRRAIAEPARVPILCPSCVGGRRISTESQLRLPIA
jgi:hypothetical protein